MKREYLGEALDRLSTQEQYDDVDFGEWADLAIEQARERDLEKMEDEYRKYLGDDSFQDASWLLEDCESIANQHPDTFDRPSNDEIRNVAVGTKVKLIFTSLDSPGPSERMWVEVTFKDHDRGFEGILCNIPYFIDDLKVGEFISFRDVHVMDITEEEGGNAEVMSPVPFNVGADTCKFRKES